MSHAALNGCSASNQCTVTPLAMAALGESPLAAPGFGCSLLLHTPHAGCAMHTPQLQLSCTCMCQSPQCLQLASAADDHHDQDMRSCVFDVLSLSCPSLSRTMVQQLHMPSGRVTFIAAVMLAVVCMMSLQAHVRAGGASIRVV